MAKAIKQKGIAELKSATTDKRLNSGAAIFKCMRQPVIKKKMGMSVKAAVASLN
jgi:hypothetical protein